MPSNDTVFICSCNQILETTDDVDRHDKSWFDLGHNKQCRYPGCTTISPQTSNAKRHWRTHLPDRLGKYFCRKCDASYVKPEALQNHAAAAVCRKNRKRCRSTSEHGAAPSSPPDIRQTATSFLDPQADDRSPPRSEEIYNDTGPMSSSITAPHVAEWNPIRPKSSPSLSQSAAYQDHGSFTSNTLRNVHTFDGQFDPVALPFDLQGMMLTVRLSGLWDSRSTFRHDFARPTSFWSLPQPRVERWWRAMVDDMIKGESGMLDSIFIDHAQSREDLISSTWSIDLEWREYQMTGHWQRVGMTRSPGKVFEVNRIHVSVTDETYGAAVDVRQNRKRRRSVFEEDPAPGVPSDMSSPGGHAAESGPSSVVPSDDTGQPTTTTAPLPAMKTPSLDTSRATPRSTAEDTENKLAKTISNGETMYDAIWRTMGRLLTFWQCRVQTVAPGRAT
jgi:hypothetical protein